MLELNRYVGERIKIGNDITLIVLGIEDGVVQLGFKAPRNVNVYRSEIYERVVAEKVRAKYGELGKDGFPDTSQDAN